MFVDGCSYVAAVAHRNFHSEVEHSNSVLSPTFSSLKLIASAKESMSIRFL